MKELIKEIIEAYTVNVRESDPIDWDVWDTFVMEWIVKAETLLNKGGDEDVSTCV